MLSRLMERITSNLTSAAQGCAPAALSDGEINRTLRSIRIIEGVLAALKVKLARAHAARRGHGDGGASTLKELGGMSARQARQSVATAKTLRRMQAVQDAVEDGQISPDNAARLALAARKTSPQAVESDSGLLAAAQSSASDDFAKTASRWEQAHQTDGGMGEHLANRRKRYLRFWAQHGMIYFKGRTDLMSGTAIRRRLEQLAQQIREQDAKTDPTPGNGTGPQPGRLTFGQAMLDALDTATDPDSAKADTASPDRVIAPDPNPDLKSGNEPHTGKRSVESTNRKNQPGDQNSADTTNHKDKSDDQYSANSTNRKGESGDQHSAGDTNSTSEPDDQHSAGSTNSRGVDSGQGSDIDCVGLSGQNSTNSTNSRGRLDGQSSASGTNSRGRLGNQGSTGGASRRGRLGGQRSASRVGRKGGGDSGSGMPKAEVVVVMDLPALLGDDNARCEIPAVGPIPAAIARRLAAVSGIVPILLDGDGEPLRHGGKRRLATRAQWQALIARDGACIGCGADPLRCEAHHDPPFSQTGRTWIDELALLCYECHHKVHDQNWRIVIKDGRRALRPPDNAQTPNPRNQSETAHRREPASSPAPDTHQPPLLC